ncbi:MAG: hypothetical protein AAF518_13435 [Spirochaetota bacterium]
MFRYVLILFIVLACSGEESLGQQGIAKEKQGKIQEAVHFYKLALQENSRYGFAHKRLGILYSAGIDSLELSLYHLKLAKKWGSADREVYLKLFDIYLILQEHMKIGPLKNDATKTKLFKQKEFNYITELDTCIAKSGKRYKDIKKLFAQKLPSISYNLLRSQAACLQGQGYDKQAKQILAHKVVTFD